MQFSASTFTDPTMRAGLEKYYNNMKTDALAALKAREADPSFQASFNAELKMPDGTTKTMTGNLMTSDMAEKAFVSFDKWLEITAQVYDTSSKSLKMAQERMETLQAQSPDSSSHVRSTFSANGQLLAYINADGSLVTSNIGPNHGDTASSTRLENLLRNASQQADAMGLTGERRVDYLNREVKNILSQQVGNVAMTSYSEATSPTKREFAKMWYTNFDVDQTYRDSLAEAAASLESAKAWHSLCQENIIKMQSYLLSMQEAA